MTLIKSLLLGSATGLVAVASAQAADLPTRKGAPAAEYVRICSITVAGKPIVGWTLPGSDTCFKIGGYVTGQIEGGNLSDSQTLVYTTIDPKTVDAKLRVYTERRYRSTDVTSLDSYRRSRSYAKGTIVLDPGVKSGYQIPTDAFHRPDFGYTTRANVALDAASNTAYGPLYAHIEMQFENGNGFDTTGDSAYINLAYVTWAGITAGKAPSFFSFTGGGPGWANMFSPDQQGFNQPDLLAYTASFGGGFSASIAAQSAGNNGGSGGGTVMNNISGINGFSGINQGVNWTPGGASFPDFVANLKVAQGWGTAQISGVAHYVKAEDPVSGDRLEKFGWGIDAGVSFNLPMIGAGDSILFTGAYTQNAPWFSGIPDGMWGENGAVNGNGQQMAIADTYVLNQCTDYSHHTCTAGYTAWATPTAWSISSTMTHYFTPEFSLSPVGSYGQVNWSNVGWDQTVSDSQSWIAGIVGHWSPVHNLDFEMEVLYQDTHTDQPDGFRSACWYGESGQHGIKHSAPSGANCNWQGDAQGFAARFEMTRNF